VDDDGVPIDSTKARIVCLTCVGRLAQQSGRWVRSRSGRESIAAAVVLRIGWLVPVMVPVDLDLLREQCLMLATQSEIN